MALNTPNQTVGTTFNGFVITKVLNAAAGRYVWEQDTGGAAVDPALTTQVPPAAAPTGAVGSATEYARADHAHPITPLVGNDTDTIDLTVVTTAGGYAVTGALRIDTTTAGNVALLAGPNGLRASLALDDDLRIESIVAHATNAGHYTATLSDNSTFDIDLTALDVNPATVVPLGGNAAGAVGTSNDFARGDHRHPVTNTLAAAASAITSTVDGVAAVLTPAAGTIDQALGFNAAGALVRGDVAEPVTLVDHPDTIGAATITIGTTDHNVQMPVDELEPMPTPGTTLDKVTDLLTIWDDSAGKHFSIPAEHLGNQVDIHYFETVTAAANGVSDTVALIGNQPWYPAFGAMWLHNGQVWSYGRDINGTSTGASGNGVMSWTTLPRVVPHDPYRASEATPFAGAPVGRVPYFTRIWQNTQTAIALDSLGKLWVIGQNDVGQAGVGGGTGQFYENWTLIPKFEDDGIKVVDVVIANGNWGGNDTDGTSVFAITDAGDLYAWGRNNYGQLGVGTTTTTMTPTKVTFPAGTVIKFAAISCNSSGQGVHSAALDSNGQLWTVGYNGQSQLGIGNTTQQTFFQEAISGIAHVALTYHSTIVVKAADQTVWAVGGNDYGHQGRGVTTAVSVWTKASSFTGKASKLWAGIHGQINTSIIDEDGNLWVCGRNAHGQLGLGAASATDSYGFVKLTAAQLPCQGKVIDHFSVADNSPTAFVLDSDGNVWSAGYNGNAQRGVGNRGDDATLRAKWLQLAIPAKVKALRAAGSNATGSAIALDENNDLWTWGRYAQMPFGLDAFADDGTAFTRTDIGYPVKIQWARNVVSAPLNPVISTNYDPNPAPTYTVSAIVDTANANVNGVAQLVGCYANVAVVVQVPVDADHRLDTVTAANGQATISDPDAGIIAVIPSGAGDVVLEATTVQVRFNITATVDGVAANVNGAASVTVGDAEISMVQVALPAGRVIASVVGGTLADPLGGTVIVRPVGANVVLAVSTGERATYSGMQKVGEDSTIAFASDGANITTSLDFRLATHALVRVTEGNRRTSFFLKLRGVDGEQHGLWLYDTWHMNFYIVNRATGVVKFDDQNVSVTVDAIELWNDGANGYVVPTGTTVLTERSITATVNGVGADIDGIGAKVAWEGMGPTIGRLTIPAGQMITAVTAPAGVDAAIIDPWTGLVAVSIPTGHGADVAIAATTAALTSSAFQGVANGGVDVTFRDLRFRMAGGGNRSLQISTVAGSKTLVGFLWHDGDSAACSQVTVNATTTPAYVQPSWNFAAAGNRQHFHFTDQSNGRMYEVMMAVGGSYNANLFWIREV